MFSMFLILCLKEHISYITCFEKSQNIIIIFLSLFMTSQTKKFCIGNRHKCTKWLIRDQNKELLK